MMRRIFEALARSTSRSQASATFFSKNLGRTLSRLLSTFTFKPVVEDTRRKHTSPRAGALGIRYHTAIDLSMPHSIGYVHTSSLLLW